MSKHTNKVNGKLNFLIVALVLVVGAVTFLLVKPISFQFNAFGNLLGEKMYFMMNKANYEQ